MAYWLQAPSTYYAGYCCTRLLQLTVYCYYPSSPVLSGVSCYNFDLFIHNKWLTMMTWITRRACLKEAMTNCSHSFRLLCCSIYCSHSFDQRRTMRLDAACSATRRCGVHCVRGVSLCAGATSQICTYTAITRNLSRIAVTAQQLQSSYTHHRNTTHRSPTFITACL